MSKRIMNGNISEGDIFETESHKNMEQDHFIKENAFPLFVYSDPIYIIRSISSISHRNIFCK